MIGNIIATAAYNLRSERRQSNGSLIAKDLLRKNMIYSFRGILQRLWDFVKLVLDTVSFKHIEPLSDDLGRKALLVDQLM